MMVVYKWEIMGAAPSTYCIIVISIEKDECVCSHFTAVIFDPCV